MTLGQNLHHSELCFSYPWQRRSTLILSFVQQILFDHLLHARHWANFFLWGSHGLEGSRYIQWDLLHFPDTDQSCCLQGIWMILRPFQISRSVICAEGDFVNSLGLLAMFWNSHLSDHLIFLKKLRYLIIESLVEFQYIKQSKVRLPWLELRQNACSFLLGLPLPPWVTFLFFVLHYRKPLLYYISKRLVNWKKFPKISRAWTPEEEWVRAEHIAFSLCPYLPFLWYIGGGHAVCRLWFAEPQVSQSPKNQMIEDH